MRLNDGSTQHYGVATFDVTVTLPADPPRHTHEPGVEIIHDGLQDLGPERLPQALEVAADRLDVDAVCVGIALPMAFMVAAPASGSEAWQVSDVALEAADGCGSQTRRDSLCRCHEQVSLQQGNQRLWCTQPAEPDGVDDYGQKEDGYPLDIASVFAMIRSVGSSRVFPIITRPERVISMAVHDHPVSDENMGRDLSRACRGRGVARDARAQLRRHPQPRRGGVGCLLPR